MLINKFKLLKKSIYTRRSSHNSVSITLLVAFCSWTNIAIAEIYSPVLFQPPRDDGQPESTEGAASRQGGQCKSDSTMPRSAREKKVLRASQNLKLTALVPQRNYGLTTQAHPTFWIYVPQKLGAQQVILSIREEESIPHWQQSVLITSAVTGIKLLNDAPALEVGKNYQWAVTLVCGERPSPNDPVITSWIKRVQKPEIARTNTSLGLSEASAYARQGIWYDALDILIAQKASLSNWNQIWTEYLQSGGLERIANEPVSDNILVAK